MRTISKVLVYFVLVSLLVGLNGGRCRAHHAASDQRWKGERHRSVARLRRCRDEHPAHHPVRPCTKAILPPDDGEKVRARLGGKAPACLPAAHLVEPSSQPPSSLFSSRPLPPSVPRHQTFCLLLI
jgi:hypothetical protein